VSNDETSAEAGAFAKEVRATFPVIHDPKGKLYDQFHSEAVPANLVIDRKGKISYSMDAGADPKALEAAVVKALK
jgi:peroxiredoxin